MPTITDIQLLSRLYSEQLSLRGSVKWAHEVCRLLSNSDLPTEDERKNLSDLEHAIIEVLSRMEVRGITVDAAALKSLGEKMYQRIWEIEKTVHETIWEPINLGSPKQLQVLLFEKLGLKSWKKTKTGYSVDEEVLTELAKETPLVALILEHRSLKKLSGTYIEGILKEVIGKKVHTTYSSIGAATGRMSSERPNLQNIPASSKGYGHDIKACFRARDENHTLIVADYSQMELRILAMLSGDPSLIEAFRSGEDIHARTAKMIYGVSEVTGDMRRTAKTVNFGVIYGVTAFGLSRQSDLSPVEAKRFIDAFFAAYPSVRSYYDELVEKGKSDGYVSTHFGRRRYLPGLMDTNKTLQAAAVREAINLPIQGTAADIVKYAMLKIDQNTILATLEAEMLLQVHDELVFECPKHSSEKASQLIRADMESILTLHGLTLKVDMHTGDNWAGAKG